MADILIFKGQLQLGEARSLTNTTSVAYNVRRWSTISGHKRDKCETSGLKHFLFLSSDPSYKPLHHHHGSPHPPLPKKRKNKTIQKIRNFMFTDYASFLSTYVFSVFHCRLQVCNIWSVYSYGDLSHMSASRPPRCKRTQRGLGGQEKKLLPEYGSDRENDEQSER